jgi:hypothetical protein
MQLNSTTCSKRRRACALAGEAFWLNSPGYGVVVHLCYRATGVSRNGGTPSSYVISNTTSKDGPGDWRSHRILKEYAKVFFVFKQNVSEVYEKRILQSRMLLL